MAEFKGRWSYEWTASGSMLLPERKRLANKMPQSLGRETCFIRQPHQDSSILRMNAALAGDVPIGSSTFGSCRAGGQIGSRNALRVKTTRAGFVTAPNCAARLSR